MNPTLLLGGAAIVLLASGKKRRSIARGRKRVSPCPLLSPGGGHMAGYDYIEFATGGASLHDRLPIVFFLHCRGCRPEGMAKYLEGLPTRARVVMPRGNASDSEYPLWFDLRSKTTDQAGLAEQMGEEGRRMAAFIEEANRCLMGVGAPIVTGHSQGGMMTFAVAAEAPGLVKAAIPVAGWLPVDLWPRTLPPTFAVHGTADRTVDYARTADFIVRAKSGGLPVDLFAIAGAGHGLGKLKSTWVDLVDSAIQS